MRRRQARGRGAAGDGEGGGGIVAAEGRGQNQGGGADAGLGAQLREQRAVELRQFGLGVIAPGRQVEIGDGHAVRLEAGIELADPRQAAHQQAGADQERQRERDLADDQRRARAPVEPRPPSCKSWPGWNRAMRHAGAAPASSAATMPMAIRKASTVPSRRKREAGAEFRGAINQSQAMPCCAKATPTRVPRAAKTPLSVSPWRKSTPRPAPREARMASSCARPPARASKRPAILAQAISSTRPTAISRITIGAARSPYRYEATGSAKRPQPASRA